MLGVQYQLFNMSYHRLTKPHIWKNIFLEGAIPDNTFWHLVKNECGGFFIARMHFGDQNLLDVNRSKQIQDMILRAADRLRGIVDAWEFVNEWGHFGDDAKALNEQSCVWIDRMHGEGHKTIVGNWGTGNPAGYCAKPYEGNEDEWLDGLRKHWELFLPMLRKSDYLGKHEYSAPGVWSIHPWHTGRHTLDWGVWPKELQDRKKWVIITECGIDSGVFEPFLKGWRYYNLTEEHYLDQLMWYDMTYLKPFPHILGATIFLVNHTDPKWESFDINGCNLISNYIKTSGSEEVKMLKDEFPNEFLMWEEAGGDYEESFRLWLMATGRLPVTRSRYQEMCEKLKDHINEIRDAGLSLSHP